MPDFKMGNPAKTIISQSGTANPTWGTGAPTGAVLNVVSSTKTATQSFTSTYTDSTITGLSCVITPKSTSNKILITGFLSVGNNVSTANVWCNIWRQIASGTNSKLTGSFGDAGGNSQRTIHSETDVRGYALRSLPINFLDSPSTLLQITYTIKLTSSSQPYHVNKDGEDNGANHSRGVCSLTAMEIAG